MGKIKQKIKWVLCYLVYHLGFLHLFLKLFFLKKRNYPAVIINYHNFVSNLEGLVETHPSVNHLISDFKKEVQFLRFYFDVVSLDQVVTCLQNGKKFTKPTVAITMDDGYRSNYKLVFPVLKEHQLPATIFLSTAVIGTTNKNWYDYLARVILKTRNPTIKIERMFGNEPVPLWSIEEKRKAYKKIVEYLKNIPIDERNQYLDSIINDLGGINNDRPLMLNWDEVREMYKGGITFGAHTHTHPILTQVPLDFAKKDILDSKNCIEKELNAKVKHFAYPNGRPSDFNKDLEQYCREIGFSSISTFSYGNNRVSSDVWELKRIGSEAPISLYAVNVVRAFLKK